MIIHKNGWRMFIYDDDKKISNIWHTMGLDFREIKKNFLGNMWQV